MLKHSRRFAAERWIDFLVLPADFFFRLQKVRCQTHGQLTVVVGVHIEVRRIATDGNVKITDTMTKRAIVSFDNFIRTQEFVGLPDGKAGIGTAVLDPTDILARARAFDNVRAVGAGRGIQWRILVGQVGLDEQPQVLPVV